MSTRNMQVLALVVSATLAGAGCAAQGDDPATDGADEQAATEEALAPTDASPDVQSTPAQVDEKTGDAQQRWGWGGWGGLGWGGWGGLGWGGWGGLGWGGWGGWGGCGGCGGWGGGWGW